MTEMTTRMEKDDIRPSARVDSAEGSNTYSDHECHELLQFQTLLAELSARFVNIPPERVDAEIQDAQKRVCDFLDLDLCALWQWEVDNPGRFLLTHLYRPLGGPPVPTEMDASEHQPWSLEQVFAKRVVVLSSTEAAPPEATRDLETWRHFGVKTTVTIPLLAGGEPPFGAVSFNDMRAERVWSKGVVQRLELVAQVFANAILRARGEQTLRRSEMRLNLAAQSAGAGMWSLDLESKSFWFTDKIRDLFGFDANETVTWDRFQSLVHPEDREAVDRALDEIMHSDREVHTEYRVGGEDGCVRWMASRGRLQRGAPWETTDVVMGVTVDVSERKRVENDLRNALEEVQDLRDQLRQENTYLRDQIRSELGHGTIVGESEPVRAMLTMARQVAPTDSTVLITGETGTGKEVLAQAIHDLSSRKDKTLIKVNCAALPALLIESELFGREKGAYTGALTRQVGRFEVANGSTIFLDEIGDLPLDLQAKLLRVLQDGQFERLGSFQTITTDARVIAATNHDLAAMVRDGDFREDLYHRLNVFPVEVPPLRIRGADIARLAWRFIQEFNKKMGRSVESLPKPAMERLRHYPWPGNVRELRNVIERAMIVSDGSSLCINLPDASGAGTAVAPSTLEDVERKHIVEVLDQTQWRISGKGGAAEILGLAPTTLHSRMKKLSLSRPGR